MDRPTASAIKRPALIRAMLRDKTSRRDAYKSAVGALLLSLFSMLLGGWYLGLFFLFLDLCYWGALRWVDKNGNWAPPTPPTKYQTISKWISAALCAGIAGFILFILLFDIHAFNDITLKYYASNGNNIATKAVLYLGANVHAEEDMALRLAAQYGDTETVKTLLDHGADINAKNGLALYSAVDDGHIDTVRLLLDRGADVSGCHGSIDINTAKKHGYKDIADLISKQRPMYTNKSLTCGADKLLQSHPLEK